MNFQALKSIMLSQNLRKTDLARRAGVSKAAVSKWFKQGSATGWINVESKTLWQLAKGLHISPGLLLKESDDLSRYQTRFLWDSLYPNMNLFVESLKKEDSVALARLVQVLGFQQALVIAGPSVLKRFPEYKKFIKPVRRRQLELLWPLYSGKR